MIVIPAIDLKDGRCVRLRQGRMDSSTIFNEDPSAQAKQWEEMGASRIHVVDLNGSVDGRPVNLHCIEDIVKTVGIPVQLGGGIRDSNAALAAKNAGADAIVTGNMVEEESLVKKKINEIVSAIRD